MAKREKTLKLSYFADDEDNLIQSITVDEIILRLNQKLQTVAHVVDRFYDEDSGWFERERIVTTFPKLPQPARLLKPSSIWKCSTLISTEPHSG